jgi:hypothetical protein
MFDQLEKFEDLSEKELHEAVEDWMKRSETVIHMLNQKKMEIRKEETIRQGR